MSDHSEDEVQVPAWITKDFLEDILRKYTNDKELELISMTFSPATQKGDHHTSCMFRAKIVYRTIDSKKIVSRSVIIKTLPEPGTIQARILTSTKVFETEVSMYTEAIPKIEGILANHRDIISFGPEIIHASVNFFKIIIMEDLCDSGYEMLRERLLSIEDLKRVLQKLAKFHAISYKISKSRGSRDVNKYQKGLFNYPNICESGLMSEGIKLFKRLLESNEELRIFLPQFEGVEEEIKKGCLELYSAYKYGQKGDIFVLNHGDFHLRNLMFKYDAENRYQDVKMVDFQLSVFGPSTIDLSYATYMIFDSAQRLEKRDEIMRFYFDSFIDTLKRTDYQGILPSFSQFQISSLKYRCFTMFLLSTFFPMMFITPASKSEDLSDIADESNRDFFNMTYMNPRFVEELKILLPMLLNKGYLD